MNAYVFLVADNTLRGIFFVHEKLTVSSVFGNGSQSFQYSIQDVLQQQKGDSAAGELMGRSGKNRMPDRMIRRFFLSGKNRFSGRSVKERRPEKGGISPVSDGRARSGAKACFWRVPLRVPC
jgi:hypothetical protein